MATDKKSKSDGSSLQASTLDDLKSNKKPMIKKVTIYLNDDHHDELKKARDEVDRATTLARSNPDKYGERLEKAEEDLKRIRELVKESAREVHFRAIGRKKYDDLISAEEHRPTEEQHEEFQKATGNPKARAPFNGDTFPQALVAASVIKPSMTLEDVEEIFTEWNGAETQELFAAAMEVNTGRRTVELGE